MKGWCSGAEQSIFEHSRQQATYAGDTKNPEELDIQAQNQYNNIKVLLNALAGQDAEVSQKMAISEIMSRAEVSSSKNKWNYLLKNFIIIDRAVSEGYCLTEVADSQFLRTYESYKAKDISEKQKGLDQVVIAFSSCLRHKALAFRDFKVLLKKKADKKQYLLKLPYREILSEIDGVQLFHESILKYQSNVIPKAVVEYEITRYSMTMLLATIFNLYASQYVGISILIANLVEMNIHEINRFESEYMKFLDLIDRTVKFCNQFAAIRGFHDIKYSDFYQRDPNLIRHLQELKGIKNSRHSTVDTKKGGAHAKDIKVVTLDIQDEQGMEVYMNAKVQSQSGAYKNVLPPAQQNLPINGFSQQKYTATNSVTSRDETISTLSPQMQQAVDESKIAQALIGGGFGNSVLPLQSSTVSQKSNNNSITADTKNLTESQLRSEELQPAPTQLYFRKLLNIQEMENHSVFDTVYFQEYEDTFCNQDDTETPQKQRKGASNPNNQSIVRDDKIAWTVPQSLGMNARTQFYLLDEDSVLAEMQKGVFKQLNNQSGLSGYQLRDISSVPEEEWKKYDYFDDRIFDDYDNNYLVATVKINSDEVQFPKRLVKSHVPSSSSPNRNPDSTNIARSLVGAEGDAGEQTIIQQ